MTEVILKSLSQFLDDHKTAPLPVPGPIVARDGSQPVRMRGEPLDEVLWQGRQWAVTRYGIECRNGLYHLNPNQFREVFEHFSYVTKVGGNGWADVDDFATAFLVACTIHRVRLKAGQVAAILDHVARARPYQNAEEIARVL